MPKVYRRRSVTQEFGSLACWCLALGVLCHGVSTGQEATVALSPFGVSNVTVAAWSQTKQLGVQWLRTHPVVWGNVEVSRGQFTFDRLDAMMRMIQDSGLVPIVPLICDSRWGAPASPAERSEDRAVPSITGTGQTAYESPRSRFPTDINAWQTFVKQIVERYDHDGRDDMPGLTMGVKYWQPVREIPTGWADTPFRLIDLLQITSSAIRESNPDAVVILPGISSRALAMLAYMDEYLKPDQNPLGYNISREGIRKMAEYQETQRLFEIVIEHGRNYYDAFDAHLFGPYSLIADKVHWITSQMQRFNYSKQIVCLEAGGPITELGEAYTDAANAEQTVKILCSAMDAGVRSLAFPLSPNFPGTSAAYQRPTLLDANGNAKPSYHTYQLLIQLLQGYKSVSRYQVRKRSYGFAFTRPEQSVYALWSEESLPIRLPTAERKAQVYQIVTQPGHSTPTPQPLTPNSRKKTKLTPIPILVEELP